MLVFMSDLMSLMFAGLAMYHYSLQLARTCYLKWIASASRTFQQSELVLNLAIIFSCRQDFWHSTYCLHPSLSVAYLYIILISRHHIIEHLRPPSCWFASWRTPDLCMCFLCRHFIWLIIFEREKHCEPSCKIFICSVLSNVLHYVELESWLC